MEPTDRRFLIAIIISFVIIVIAVILYFVFRPKVDAKITSTLNNLINTNTSTSNGGVINPAPVYDVTSNVWLGNTYTKVVPALDTDPNKFPISSNNYGFTKLSGFGNFLILGKFFSDQAEYLYLLYNQDENKIQIFNTKIGTFTDVKKADTVLKNFIMSRYYFYLTPTNQASGAGTFSNSLLTTSI